MINVYDMALNYASLGIKLIPVSEDKSPARACVDHFRGIPYDVPVAEADVSAMFANDCEAVALLCGNGFECIDIDSKNYTGDGDLFKLYVEHIRTYDGGEELLKKCYIQQTRSGGSHIIYKTDNKNIGRNKKLASEEYIKDSGSIGKRVIIETRGQHGYCLIYPSVGYVPVFNHIDELKEISLSERNILFSAAVIFNTYETVREQVRSFSTSTFNGEKIWNKYNEETDVVAYMETKGWTKLPGGNGSKVYMKRPDNGKATTAINSGNYHVKYKKFIAHTTSTELENEKPYSAFDLLVLLDYRGDIKSALRSLRETNKIDSILTFKEVIVPVEEQVVNVIIPEVELFGAIIHNWDEELPPLKPTLFVNHRLCKEPIGIGLENSIGVITGAAKSRKTQIAYEVVKSAVTGNNYCGFEFQLDLHKKVMVIDTEQPLLFFRHRLNYMKAFMDGKHDRLMGISVSRLNKSNRIKMIHNILEDYRQDVGLILIDGIVDLAEDYNDLKEAQRLIDQVNHWRDSTNAIILNVIHTTADGKMRGHVGTEITNKCDFAIEARLNKEIPDESFVRSKLSRVARNFPEFKICQIESGKCELSSEYEIKSFTI